MLIIDFEGCGLAILHPPTLPAWFTPCLPTDVFPPERSSQLQGLDKMMMMGWRHRVTISSSYLPGHGIRACTIKAHLEGKDYLRRGFMGISHASHGRYTVVEPGGAMKLKVIVNNISKCPRYQELFHITQFHDQKHISKKLPRDICRSEVIKQVSHTHFYIYIGSIYFFPITKHIQYFPMKDISFVKSFHPNNWIVILFDLIFDLGYGNCILMPSFMIMDSIYKIMRKHILNITILFQERNSRFPLLIQLC